MAKTKVHGEFLKDSVVRFTAKAGENITKGQAVYISGVSGEVPVVSLADADDTAKMPAFGLAEATVSTNAEVEITSFGTLKGLDTSSYSLGDILYVHTTAGSLTNNPSGLEATKLQNIGMVQRVHATSGSIKVGGAGRTNAVPNLDDGDIFIGDSNNKAISSPLSTEIESYLDGGTSTPILTSLTVNGATTITKTGTNASPHIKLTESGDTREFNIYNDGSGNGRLVLADTDDTPDTEIVLADNGILQFKTANSLAMTIDSSQRVGIGCTPTSYATEIQATTGGNGLKIRGRSAGGNEGWLAWTDNADNVEAAMYATADNLIFANTTSYTERMRIDSSGRVLVGATSSAVHSNVDDLQIGNGTGSRGIGIHSANNANGAIFFSDPDSTLAGQIEYSHDRDDFVFVTGTATRLRIDSDGLKFGSDTAAANALDDYEEGTWTAYQNSGLTAAMGSATQHYTKIGRQVILRFDITNNSGSSADRIYGTPFSNNGHGTMFVAYSNISNDNKVAGYTDSGSIRLTLLGQTGSWSIPNNYRIIGTAWYITD